MKLGTNNIGSVYLGSNAVQKVYLGTNEVWSSYAYLLNDYPNAAAAYSLRKLRLAYTGSAIRVRRASDNSEQDIGFVNNELDTSTLTSFCSGTDGFVKTWYDQSGNGYNATQTTAANQPQIVSSGGVITQGSKPTIKFDGSGDYLDLGSITYGNNCNTVVVTKGNNQLGGIIAVQEDAAAGNGMQLWDFQSKYTSFNSTGSNLLQHTNSTDYVVLQQGRNTSSTSYLNVNNNLQTQTPTTQDTNARNYYLGTIRSNQYRYNGNIQEVIIYLSNQYSNLSGIETNINDFYSIY